MVWGTYLPPQRWFCELSQIGAWSGLAPGCPVECGVQSLFGQCPNVGGDNFYGCSLSRAPMPLQILLLIPLPHTDINRNTQGTSDMLLRGVQAPHMCTRHMLLGTPLRFLIIVMMPMFSCICCFLLTLSFTARLWSKHQLEEEPQVVIMIRFISGNPNVLVLLKTCPYLHSRSAGSCQSEEWIFRQKLVFVFNKLHNRIHTSYIKYASLNTLYLLCCFYIVVMNASTIQPGPYQVCV